MGPDLGDDHPDTLISIHNFARLLRDNGDVARAEELLVESVGRARVVLPETHTFLLVPIGSLGAIRGMLGSYADGEALLLESYKGLSATLAPGHERTVKCFERVVFGTRRERGIERDASAKRADMTIVARADT